MATDWWPEQEGRLTDGLTIMCNAEGSVTEGTAVKFGTSTASQMRVQNASSTGDGWGIALKACSTAGEACPVIVYGLWKSTLSNGTTTTITQGDFVMNSGTIYISATGTRKTTTMKQYTGSSYFLGMAMQSATANGDELVILVGRSG